MELTLTEPERDLLSELLDVTLRTKLIGLHRTSTAAYKETLAREIEIIEELKAKVAKVHADTARY